MGAIYVTIEVGDVRRERFETVEVRVDAGSTFSQISGELLRRLEVLVQRIIESELADGSIENVRVGEALIRLE